MLLLIFHKLFAHIDSTNICNAADTGNAGFFTGLKRFEVPRILILRVYDLKFKEWQKRYERGLTE